MSVRRYRDGFELEAPGERPAPVEVLEAEKGFVTITDEKAPSGKHSLKFVDAAGLLQHHLPHIFFRPNLHDSIHVRFSFNLYREPGAVLYVEWRDYTGYRQTGPAIRIQEDCAFLLGKESANSRIPESTWVHFEMTDGLGELAGGKWDLKITTGDNILFDRKGIPCDAEFSSIEWLGIVSYGDKPAVFYVDNLSFGKCAR